jgi:small subunit ribosomal protein S3
MGQKVNPVVFRLGLTQQWSSKWYSGQGYSQLLEQDIKIRKFLKSKIKEAGIDRIEIERSRGEITINITVAKPGLVIGRGGTGIEDLKKIIAQKYLPPKVNLKINVVEVDKINLSPGAVLQMMAADIEKRIAFRRVMKQTIEKVMKAGAEGVKIVISGRLNGAEIARRETLTQGKIPLHTLRANIAYSRGVAQTTYGTIGIKIWIYKGLQFEAKEENKVKREEAKK